MPDIVTSQVFATGEKNITATKMNNIVGGSVIQPSFVSSKPVASSVNPADNLLLLTQGGTYAQVPFSTISSAGLSSVSTDAGNLATLGSDSKILVPQSAITSIRLRSYNAIGNPTFEVDQRQAGGLLANAANGTWPLDRWTMRAAGSMVVSSQQTAGLVVVPGTNFVISRCFLRLTLTTQEATLGASDYLSLHQWIEGPAFREIIGDVFSTSLLVRCSVPLKFGVSLHDNATTKGLTNLCTIAGGNTWTLVTVPNQPVIPAGANFSTGPGTAGQFLRITLAAGSSLTTPANGTWQSSASVLGGAVGQDNFAASPTSATFDIALVQLEPGAVCTTPIDCPFQKNYDDCLRYFCKSYPYAIKVGVAGTSYALFNSISATSGSITAYGGERFWKPMAKLPTCIPYQIQTGVANQALIYYASSGAVPNATATLAISGTVATESALIGLTGSITSTAPVTFLAEYSADTGW